MKEQEPIVDIDIYKLYLDECILQNQIKLDEFIKEAEAVKTRLKNLLESN